MTFHALLVAAAVVAVQPPQQPQVFEPDAGLVNPVVITKVHVMVVLEFAPGPRPIGADVFGRGAYQPGKGLVNPVVITKVEPKYPSDATRARLQGEVWIDAVILADGSLGDVQVAKSLDNGPGGLDEAALAAARRWRFKPGTVNNVAVPVLVQLVLEFRQ